MVGLVQGLGAAATPLVTLEWVAVYDGPCSGGDFASDMCLDSEGNVIVTGSGDMTATNHDTVTIKYDPDGNVLWTSTYDDPYGDDVDFDRAFAVAVDSDDNVYIAGWARGATSTDYLTVAYSPDGEELWVATWDSPFHMFDWADDLVVDSEGRIYVSGTIYTDTQGEDLAIVCYDSSGELLWYDIYSGEDATSDFPYSLHLCEADAIVLYAVGYADFSYYLEDADGLVLAYDTDGEILWEYHYDDPGWDGFFDAVFDSSGNAYITGCTSVDDDPGDLLFLALDGSGEEMWTTTCDGGAGGLDAGYTLAMDASGNLYASGYANGVVPDDPYSDPFLYADGFVAACDPDGDVLWTSVDEGGDLDESLWSLAISDDGYLYVTGCTYAPTITDNVGHIRIYDTDGNELWSDEFHQTDETGDYTLLVLAGDDGDFYILGATFTDAYAYDIPLLKYHSLGSATDYVDEVKDVIDDLPASAFSKNADQRVNALSSKLDAVAKMIDDGDYQDAIDKLEQDIIPKMDGVEQGNAKDWITDPDAQQELCGMLQALIDYLGTMI